MVNPSSVLPPSALTNLEGSLSLTSVPDLLQFIQLGNKNGELKVVRTPEGVEGRVYCADGLLIDVRTAESRGLQALAEIVGWVSGYFRFKPGVRPSETTIQLPLQHALMEALRLRDESLAAEAKRSELKMANSRSSADVLQDLLKSPGINAVVVVGRDGFLIESAGNAAAVDLDSIGAALAHAVNGVEELGGDLKIDKFHDLFIEYKHAVLICQPVGDALVALVSPDASKLGIIRHKTKKLIEELATFF